MSFGRLTAAVLSGTIDTTVALASLNFDFSLIKVEARKEYKDFGMQLSKQRSEEAENGLTHVTARKLGALFADIIPPCPHLISAYGLRVSEIAKSSTHNPKGTKIDGIFADQLGADGTSIWAAATSGDPAIGVHLLACMLARMWPAPKAVSIWVELILERKKELLGPDNQDSTNPFSMTAAQISICRDQLAKWDSSARAWLQIADAAKQLPQKQLMLIVNNISTAVNEKPAVYDSVVLAWKSAMRTADKLASGVSQSIQNGAPLLGLLSWHLYPDMLVLGPQTKEVKQHDELIPTGTLVTAGLQHRTSTTGGVFWSLPLAHIRFYGDPIMVRSSTMSETGLTINQLLQVALGSLIGQWTTKFSEFDAAAQLIVSMRNSLQKTQHPSATWLDPFADASETYLNSSGLDRKECTQLLKTGRRRYPNFLVGKKDWTTPFLGLTSPTTLLELSTGHEARISILRNFAARYGDAANRMIIRYRVQNIPHLFFEYATASPQALQRGKKRERDGRISVRTNHVRWVNGQFSGNFEERCQEIISFGEDPTIMSPQTFVSQFESGFSLLDALKWNNPPAWFREEVYLLYGEQTEKQQRMRDALSPAPVPLELVIGDPNTAALYSVQEEHITPHTSFDVQDIDNALSKKYINPEVFKRFISLPTTKSLEAISSFRALWTMAEVYKDLTNARIAVKVANTPIHKAKWAGPVPSSDCSQRLILTLAQTFSCISRFESGTLDIDPVALQSVMAMSSGNSLFIASSLLGDPIEFGRRCKVKRVVGNIGRPGIAMMVSPRWPMMRKFDPDKWNLINHHPFDGSKDDLFEHTTLHISYTDWEMPIEIGEHGTRDREVFFLEAPISIHDRGKWVADVDILRMFSDPKFRLLQPPECPGHDGVDPLKITQEIEDQGFINIDSWEELLDTPLEPAVLRAQLNWQARLAAAALSVQRGHVTGVVPLTFCWSCHMKNKGDTSEALWPQGAMDGMSYGFEESREQKVGAFSDRFLDFSDDEDDYEDARTDLSEDTTSREERMDASPGNGIEDLRSNVKTRPGPIYIM
jgi:hypothetical protein